MALRLSSSRVVVLLIVAAGTAWCNQIVNSGFEAGNFTGWTLSGDTSCMGVVAAGSTFFIANSAICGGLSSSIVHSGNFAAYLGSQNSDGLLSQTVATVPGVTYDINFWLASLNLGTNTPNDFFVSWNGVRIMNSTNLAASGLTDFDFRAGATSTSTSLTFGERNEFSYFVLDDISVTAVGTTVPEPPGSTLTAASLIALAFAKRMLYRSSPFRGC